MTGTHTFAERVNSKAEETRVLEEVGLTGLGAQLSNTQLLEHELMGDNGDKIDEDLVEVDMDDDENSDQRNSLEEPTLPTTNGRSDRSRSKSPSKQGGKLPGLLSKDSQDLSDTSLLKRGFRDQIIDPDKKDESPVDTFTEEGETRQASKAASFNVNYSVMSTMAIDEGFQSAREEGEVDLKERFKASNTECEILRARVFQLEKELKETQDFVFSMQPRAARLTESDALADFNSLWRSVDEWVQTKLADSIEAMTLGKERVPLGQASKIMLSIVPPPGREAFRYKDTDEYNITAVIMRCLADWILDRDFYCNIEKGGMDFLHSIEKAMRNLEPRRDHITCRTWRAETYLAITNRQSFTTFQSKLRDQVAYDLTHILHIFSPRTDEIEFGRSIVKSIVDPALALAHKIHLSVDKYSIRWTPYHTATWEQRQTMSLDLSQFECVDLISGRTIKFPLKGKNLTYVFDLAPGLVLETAQAQFFGEPKILKKPRVLVAATKEEDGFYDPQLPRPGDPYTLLGWMEERLHAKSRSLFG